jgi:transcriptional regulator with XRE-family HTH domain
MVLLRRELGDTLRSQRQRQSRTLREVSSAARVSLGYLSEVERGHKEASSELLAAICEALDVRMSDVLREVSDNLARAEAGAAPSGRAGAPPAAEVSAAPVRRPRPVGRTTLQEVIPAVEAGSDDTPRVVAAA